jgi:hypothetical protein
MKNFEHATELVFPHERTVVVFTRGLHLKINDRGIGESGKWVITKNSLEGVEKVIIYLRNDAANTNQLYLADYIGYHPSDEDRRLVIEFANFRQVGTTQNNWTTFAALSQSPIGVINK